MVPNDYASKKMRRETICKGCGLKKPHRGFGLCQSCYNQTPARKEHLCQYAQTEERKKYLREYEHTAERKASKKLWRKTERGRLIERKRKLKRRTGSNPSIVDTVIALNRIKFGVNSCERCFCLLPTKFQIDHIIPVCRNGKNSFENLQILCRCCNSSKWTKTQDYRLTIYKTNFLSSN